MIVRGIGEIDSSAPFGTSYPASTPTWTREAALMVGSRITPDSSYRAAAAAQGKPLPPPSGQTFVQGPIQSDAPSAEEPGIPRAVLIGGGAVAVVALAAVAYKFLL